jgi:hypothetical protein
LTVTADKKTMANLGVTQQSSTALIAGGYFCFLPIQGRQRWRNDKSRTSGTTIKGAAARRLRERLLDDDVAGGMTRKSAAAR